MRDDSSNGFLDTSLTLNVAVAIAIICHIPHILFAQPPDSVLTFLVAEDVQPVGLVRLREDFGAGVALSDERCFRFGRIALAAMETEEPLADLLEALVDRFGADH